MKIVFTSVFALIASALAVFAAVEHSIVLALVGLVFAVACVLVGKNIINV